MQPDQNQPDYSFLNNAPSAQAGPSKKKRIMIAIGGGSVLLIVLIIVASLLFGGGGDNTQTSLKLAQMHTELIRVSELGKERSRGQAAKNLATTTNLTLQSSEASIVAVASKEKKVATKLLSAGEDPKTDKTLTEAEQRSQFDDIFIPLLVDEIKEYQIVLKQTYESSKSKSNKATYEALFLDLNKIVQAAELSQ